MFYNIYGKHVGVTLLLSDAVRNTIPSQASV